MSKPVYELERLKQAQKFLASEEEREEKRLKISRVVFKDLGSFLIQQVWNNGPKLLVWDKVQKQVLDVREEFEYDGVRYKPFVKIPLKRNGEPAIGLASYPMDYGSERELISEVKAFIQKYCELEPSSLEFLSRFVLHTWIYDFNDYAIYVFLHGLIGVGKTRVAKILSLVCYNSLFVSGNTSFSAYKRLISRFRGTLLINEFEPRNDDDSDEIIAWLNNGFEKDNPFALSRKNDPEKQDFYDSFGPKVFTTRRLVENSSLLSRAVLIEMHEASRKDIPVKLGREAYLQAALLRNKLLMFRLKHYHDSYELSPELDERLRNDSNIPPRFKQQALPMLTLYEIAGLNVEEAFDFYHKLGQEFKKRVATTTLEGILFNAILEICHQDSYDEEFLGFIDENKKLVGVGLKLLQKRVDLSQRLIAKTLQRIGMVSEKRKKPVLIWDKEINSPVVKDRTLRLWVFPNEKAWREAFERYFYQEDSNPGKDFSIIPEVLKSLVFMPEPKPNALTLSELGGASGAGGVSRNRYESGGSSNLTVPTSATCATCATNQSILPLENNETSQGSVGETAEKHNEDSLLKPVNPMETTPLNTGFQVEPKRNATPHSENNYFQGDPSMEHSSVLYACKSCLSDLEAKGQVVEACEKWVQKCEICGEVARG